MKNSLLIFFLFASFGISQNFNFSENPYNPLNKPNTYKNIDNPNYWKNKKPYQDYWQQDVYYEIKAEIDDQDNVISATQKLTYWNNSPDELDIVYFHLYQNAFQEDSYYEHLKKVNNRVDEKFKGVGRGTEILSIKSGGFDLKTELDNTILKVYLNEPLKTGEKIVFNIDFKTFFNKKPYGRRMKYYDSWDGDHDEETKKLKHYNGVHWYPRISVYDAKFGWTIDQHLVKEFYGNFGAFDVELTFPSNYIVEATGNMINRNEVLPPSLRKKIDIKNFANKPWNEKPSIIIPHNPKVKKTWKFHAENVHDFAFTADPTYRIGESEWNGIKCYSLAQEHHASRWQNAADYTAKTIQVLSEDIGMYVYHKMIVSDARDGMEYPMLTLDSGFDPYYRDLFVHEIGHNWFYGMVGSNETYRASLDEGFTQFLTAWGLNKIDGPYSAEGPKSRLFKNEEFKLLAIDEEIYNRYMKDATINNTPKLNTHSHDFGSALRHGGGYRHVYYKPGVMLYNLQYVLGDDLFLKAMQDYFNTWKMCHPYFQDFRNSIIKSTKVDLNWFFDQWLETTKGLDYSVSNVEKIDQANYKIEIKRDPDGMEMPIDLVVISKFGLKKRYHIPNKEFIKKTKHEVLPKWTGFGKLNQTYSFSVFVADSSGIENVIIDPTYRLGDNYMLNNRLKGNTKYSLDYGVNKHPDWKFYELKARPGLGYNSYDGIKLGINMKSGYLGEHHIINSFFLINSTFLNDQIYSNKPGNDIFSYGLNYSTSLDKYVKNSTFYSSIKHLDGLDAHSFSLKIYDRHKENSIKIGFKGMIRKDYNDLNYLLNENLWGPYGDPSSGKYNSIFSVNLSHKYKYVSGEGDIDLSLRSSSWLSDYNFSQITFSTINKSKFHGFDIKTRLFAQTGFGKSFPIESMLFAAGANPEEMMNYDLSRSAGLISKDAADYGIGTNHFHVAGGLNLRGYSGNYMLENSDNGIINTNYGIAGISMNIEISYINYLRSLTKNYSALRFLNELPVDSYIFYDIGVINNDGAENDYSFGSLKSDMGLGFTFDLGEIVYDYYDLEKPLLVRIDFPFFVSDPASTENNIKFRWLLGINKSF